MIAFATLVFAQALSPLPADTAQSMLTPLSVATIAQRLPLVQANVSQSARGGWLCALTASTGSPYVDDRVCRATVICTIRQNKGRQDYGQCMRKEQDDMLDDYGDALKR